MNGLLIRQFILALVLATQCLLTSQAQANDHGGGPSNEPMVFTVNAGKKQYLQFGLILEAASPEASHLLSGYKPKIQHEIILLLATKEADQLRTLAGKKELMEEIVETVNHVIHESEKTGVKEVLFTRFLIQ